MPSVEEDREPVDTIATSFVPDRSDAEHHRTQSDIADNETRLREILATLDLSTIMVRSLSGTVLYWSEGCTRLFGWTAAEAVGRKTHDLLHTVSPMSSAEIEAELLATGEWRGDLRETPKDGNAIVVAARKRLRRDETGAPVAIAVVYDDVTLLRQAQMELQQLNQHLESRVEEEVRKREAAQQRAAHAERIQALGQLTGGIAHDLNNVLQAVSSGAALTTRDAENPERVRRLARLLAEAAARGAAVTRRLLSFSRRGDLRAEPIEAGALLTDLVDVLSYTLGGNIRFEVEVQPGLPRLFADRGQLETALVNLATNARDAMPNGGVISLSAASETVPAARSRAASHPFVSAPGRYIRLTVRDAGTGMDAATLARAQEPFFSTKRDNGGTGLGLATAGGFVRQSGGAIGIESKPGVGTAVSLWLPEASPAAAPVRRAPPVSVAAPPVEDHTDPTRPVRVLLVDDDIMVRDVMAQELQGSGYAVSVCDDGSSALSLLDGPAEFDVLVCDLSMPGMSGIEAIKAAQARRPGLPAILLSGYAGDAAALPSGGASFALLRKPATMAQLADVIALLMGA